MPTHDAAPPVLTVDGPSGSGKGTVSRRVAEALGWHMLDSGALYRAVGLAAGWAGLDLADEPAVARCAREIDLDFRATSDGSDTRVLVAGKDVSGQLRTETCGAAASAVAALPAVRDALLAKQRAFRKPPGLVADGRDMGTVVFADARFKVFLTASADERANRRYKQLKDKGLAVTIASLLRDIKARDERDANREVAPLRPADDAVVIDTTDMPVVAVVARIMALLDLSKAE